MQKQTLVDWNGLVYYDSKIKQYIDYKTTFLDDVLFQEDLIVNTPVGDFNVGDSVYGLTLKAILTKLLNLSTKVSTLDEIIEAALPVYVDIDGVESEAAFNQIDDTAAPQENGFYVTKLEGSVTSAGYQISTPAGTDNVHPSIYIPESVNIVKIHQYDEGLTDSWNLVSVLPDETYFKCVDKVSKIINGQTIMYNKYEWNADEQGGGIYVPCNWRFEIEL